MEKKEFLSSLMISLSLQLLNQIDYWTQILLDHLNNVKQSQDVKISIWNRIQNEDYFSNQDKSHNRHLSGGSLFLFTIILGQIKQYYHSK